MERCQEQDSSTWAVLNWLAITGKHEPPRTCIRSEHKDNNHIEAGFPLTVWHKNKDSA